MKNLRTIEKSGKTVEEAVSAALSELGIAQDDAVIEVIEEGSKGFLGIGSKEATVKVTEKLDIEKITIRFLDSMISKIVDEVNYDVEYNVKGIKLYLAVLIWVFS